MKKIVAIMNLVRSIPAILAFLLSKNKNKIKEDMLNNSYIVPYNKKDGILALNYLLVRLPEYRNTFYFRIKDKNPIIGRIIQIFYLPLRDILIGGDIDGGLVLFHGYSSVIYVNKAGKNLSVYQQVTIGKNPKDGNIPPTIGNNVNIYAGAKLMGNIIIGDNVDIGAGSVVTKSVPSNCVVVGNPARIIKRNGIRVNEKL